MTHAPTFCSVFGQHFPWPTGCRRAFTVLEILVALGILLTVMVLLGQTISWSIGEQDRKRTRYEATEAAANILEAARACPWDQLTDDWARSQPVPASLTGPFYLGQAKVAVATEPARPRVKRVTVTIQWQHGTGSPVQSVQLVGWFSARTASAKGEK